MNIQSKYIRLTEGKELTSMSKMTIQQLTKTYSHLATLPLREESDGISCTKLFNILNVDPSRVTAESPEGLSFGDKLIKGLRLVKGEIEVVNCKPTNTNFVYKEEYLPLKELLAFVYMQNEYIPSKWLANAGPAYESPGTSAMAPFVLLAFKRYKGTPFNAWDKYDKNMNKLLSKNLIGLPDCASTRKFDRKEIHGIVELMFYANRQKQQVKPTGYPMLNLGTAIPRCVELAVRDENAPMSDAESLFTRIPPNLRRMFLQTWMFNAKHRTNDIILDAEDWSATPEDVWEGFIGFASLGVYRASSNNLVFSQGEL